LVLLSPPPPPQVSGSACSGVKSRERFLPPKLCASICFVPFLFTELIRPQIALSPPILVSVGWKFFSQEINREWWLTALPSLTVQTFLKFIFIRLRIILFPLIVLLSSFWVPLFLKLKSIITFYDPFPFHHEREVGLPPNHSILFPTCLQPIAVSFH